MTEENENDLTDEYSVLEENSKQEEEGSEASLNEESEVVTENEDSTRDDQKAEDLDKEVEDQDEVEEEPEEVKPAVLPPVPEEEKEPPLRAWYILKVQVNREDTIRENLRKRIQLAGYGKYFDDILVPTEKVTSIKNGQRRTTKRKLYPGYIMVKMEINDDTWFLVRETPGVGDFTGAGGKPIPMEEHEVQRMLQTENSEITAAPKLNIPYAVGEDVKIVDGSFKDLKGEVTTVDNNTGRVTVKLVIMGHDTTVDLEYWQAEKAEE